MADRTVIVRLQAEVAQYKAAMNQAAASTTRVGAAAEASAAASTAAASKQIASARSVTAATEKQAVASTLASKKQLTAAEAGVVATTKQTSAFKGMGVMIGALGLAAFAKSSVDAFKQVTGEVASMRRVTGGAPEDVSRLRYALKLTGIDIDQFSRSAGIFDKKMIAASASTEKTAVLNEKLGTSFLTAEGNVRPLIELLPEIGEKFKTMGAGPESAALALDLFGRAGRSMLPFLARGKEGIDALMASTDAASIVNEAQIQKNKELLVSQRKLGEAVTALEMSFGSALVPVLQTVADALTPIVSAFNELPGPMKAGIVYAGAAAVAYGLLAGKIGGVASALGTMATAQSAAATATAASTTAAGGGAAATAATGAAAGGAVSGFTLLSAAVVSAAGSFALFKGLSSDNTLLQIGSGIVSSIAPIMGIPAAVLTVGTQVHNATTGINADFGETGKKVGEVAAQFGTWAANGDLPAITTQLAEFAKAGVAGDQIAAMAAQVPGLTDYLSSLGLQVSETTGLIESAAVPLTEMGEAAADLGTELTAAGQALKDLQALMSGAASADAAITSWRQFTAGLKENGMAWDGVSNKAISNRAAIMAYASDAVQAGGNAADAIERVGAKMGLSAAQTQQLGERLLTVDGYAAALGARNVAPKVGADTATIQAKIAAVRERLERLAEMKPSPKVDAETAAAKAKLENLLRKLGDVDAAHPEPTVTAETGQAKSALGGILNQIGNIQDKNVTITTTYHTIGAPGGGGGGSWASGGRISGPGTGTSDSIPIMASNGEYVVRAAAASRNQAILGYINSGGVVPHFKKGGAVAAAKAAAEVKATPAAADAAIAAGGKAAKIYTKAHPKSAAAAVRRGAAGAAADAETSFEEAQTSLESAQTSADSAQSEAERAAEALASARKSVADAFAAAASITKFSLTQNASDLDAVTSAQNNLVTSSQALAVARAKANTASRADRPDAIRALAEANLKYAAATKAVADAKVKEAKSKVTPENILGSMRSRLGMMQGFIGNLGTLKARGLHPSILSDILASGLVDGSAMAAALVGAGDLTGFNAAQQAINDTSAQLGVFSTDITIGPSPEPAPTPAPAPAPSPSPSPGGRGGPSRRARGGPVQAGRAYLVGEQGIETFIPAQSGTIVPAANHMSAATSTFQPQNFTASQPLQMCIDTKVFWDGIVDYNVTTGFTLRALSPN